MSLPIAIIYLDDVATMHVEWEANLGPWLSRLGIQTLHCIGYESDYFAPEGLALLHTHELIAKLAQFSIPLIVTDVVMPFPTRERRLGGLYIVRQVILAMGDEAPSVLFASSRPEREMQSKLAAELQLNILGEVLIDGDRPENLDHWKSIQGFILLCLDGDSIRFLKPGSSDSGEPR